MADLVDHGGAWVRTVQWPFIQTDCRVPPDFFAEPGQFNGPHTCTPDDPCDAAERAERLRADPMDDGPRTAPTFRGSRTYNEHIAAAYTICIHGAWRPDGVWSCLICNLGQPHG